MGAWTTYTAADGTTTRWYKRTRPLTTFDETSARGYGCVAIKHELVHLGLTATGFNPETPLIGSVAEGLLKTFQREHALTADGVVGPATAELLFWTRLLEAEHAEGVPDRWAGKIVKLESSEDPGATGWSDPRDKGLCQINVDVRRISDAQAFDPAFSCPYLANDLAEAHRTIRDWEGAVAAWNVGGYWAERWVEAGKPTSGAWDEKNHLDWYTRASNYVSLVDGQVLRA